MIGHYNKFVQYGMGKMFGNLHPTLVGNFTGFIQLHGAFGNGSEQTLAVMGYNGYEICPRLRIIKIF